MLLSSLAMVVGASSFYSTNCGTCASRAASSQLLQCFRAKIAIRICRLCCDEFHLDLAQSQTTCTGLNQATEQDNHRVETDSVGHRLKLAVRGARKTPLEKSCHLSHTCLACSAAGFSLDASTVQTEVVHPESEVVCWLSPSRHRQRQQQPPDPAQHLANATAQVSQPGAQLHERLGDV